MIKEILGGGKKISDCRFAIDGDCHTRFRGYRLGRDAEASQ
ncbi:MAG: hypothetical protein NTX52_15800 [Planctomycetota bacterium]|nr:hypothetical protein [Planctomycetota bacterium]